MGVTPARADHFLGHVDCSDVANLNQFGECIGTGGTDLLDGEGHQDWTDGGNGDDYLYGYAGNDMLNGGRGRDVSEVADRGKDRIDCGKGKDKVVIDEADMVDDNCKRQIAVT